ncbi:FtsX-like permease family protein [Stenomitos frigidus]|uniref:FtsX-like permease family protein n=1 Tax=Stenomitos frigidus TaxID=1886765 RepID=UPI0011B27D87|nr:FtsX-like permease family protein [Stenomitos frigidus]
MFKAFGYGNWDIGAHFLKLVLVIVFLSAVIGTGVGVWLWSEVTKIYTAFYKFPLLRYAVIKSDRLTAGWSAADHQIR